MLQRLKQNNARWQLVCEAFGLPHIKEFQKVAETALTKDYRVSYLSYDSNGTVSSKDISNLDPDSEIDSESGWGGLTEFSSRFGEAVRNAVNENLLHA